MIIFNIAKLRSKNEKNKKKIKNHRFNFASLNSKRWFFLVFSL